ncbi:sulfurtransferase TusA family protein [Acetobacter vaccinii]|uniref:Sulfurtransferase TusA family protein n=1 Tax=Acetobacter vaccinii TaxID=2592655 RepID=A0A5C1YLG7_9PROT|nr:sulfurtransferase TusA family protein [Acetobacter vaccinii]QEO16741.1 sulfurtransferase TusA family protein [Acetobacter vaccinii]
MSSSDFSSPGGLSGGVSTVQKDRALDITADRCPMTFVRVRLALDQMVAGQVLVVRLMGEEPHRNVTRSVQLLGHTLLADAAQDDGSVVLRILKA